MEGKLRCSCEESVFEGLPCRHEISICVKSNFSLENLYFAERWRKEYFNVEVLPEENCDVQEEDDDLEAEEENDEKEEGEEEDFGTEEKEEEIETEEEKDEKKEGRKIQFEVTKQRKE